MQDYPGYNPYDMAYARGVNQKTAIRELEGKVFPKAVYSMPAQNFEEDQYAYQ